jgi:hypothetical protein
VFTPEEREALEKAGRQPPHYPTAEFARDSLQLNAWLNSRIDLGVGGSREEQVMKLGAAVDAFYQHQYPKAGMKALIRARVMFSIQAAMARSRKYLESMGLIKDGAIDLRIPLELLKVSPETLDREGEVHIRNAVERVLGMRPGAN